MKSASVVATVLAVLVSTCAVSDEMQSDAGARGKVAESCRGLTGTSLQECMRVARKMEESSTTGTKAPADAPRAEAPNNIHHSSPVMDTPEQKAAAAARRKGQDPAKAVEKAKEP